MSRPSLVYGAADLAAAILGGVGIPTGFIRTEQWDMHWRKRLLQRGRA